MPKDPTTVSQRWATNLAGASAKITEGVQAVTQAPGTKAAAAKAKWAQKVAASQDKWAANVARVGLSDWQRAMTDKGIPRVATGAQAATPKMQNFFSQALPYIETLRGQVNGMPSLTLEDSVNRASAFIRGMSKFSYKK